MEINVNTMKKGFAIVSILLACHVVVNAQTKDNTTGLTGEIIEKNYIKPKLADAVKIDVTPVQENIEVKKPEMSYTIEPFSIASSAYKSKLAPVFIKNTPLPELHKGFVEGAFGNYSNLYAEAYYNTLRSRTSLLSIDVKHWSGTGPTTPASNSLFSTNSIDIFGSQIFKAKYDLTYSGGFERDANRFYANIPDFIPATSNLQAFNDLHLKANIANTGADTGKLKYNAGVAFYNFSDYYKTDESDVTATLKMDEPLNANHIILDGSYDLMNYKTVGAESRTLLRINLGYNLNTDKFRAYLGFKTAAESDSNASKFHFYPDLKLEYDLIDKYVTALGGITGNLDKTTYKEIAQDNPFIISDPSLKNSNDKFELFAGIRGSFSKNSSFLLRGAFMSYQDYFFFMQDTVDRRKYLPVYDNGTTTILNLHGEVAWSFMDNLDLNTKFDLNSYSVSDLSINNKALAVQKPFEMPGFTWMLTGNYRIENKIVIGGDLFFVSSRYAADLSEKTITTLNPFIDLNAHVSYAFANIPGFKAFIQLNNIFGYQYQYWNDYPVRGFQIVGGGMFSFM